MPMVSVIIPVYNTAPWLEECLESIVNQTFADLEIICINDGSTDASADILEKYAKNDNRIKVIMLEHNTGQSHARNIGIEMSCGEYIYFMDSDDVLELCAIECLYATSCKKKLDILYFDSQYVFESDVLRRRFKTYSPNRRNVYSKESTTGKALFLQFMNNDEWVAEVPRQFISAKLIKDNSLRFIEGIYYEDSVFSIQCILLAHRAMYIDDRFYVRRFRVNSTITSKKSVRYFSSWFCAVYHIVQLIQKENLYYGSIRSYIARVNNEAVALYNLFMDDAKQEIMKLQNSDITKAFWQFEAMQDIYTAYGVLSEKVLQRIKNYEEIYLYGAGIVAKSVYDGLVKQDFVINGFIVTDMVNNPKALAGHPVMNIQSFLRRKKESYIIIVAVKNGKDEINDILDHMQIEYVNYDE